MERAGLAMGYFKHCRLLVSDGVEWLGLDRPLRKFEFQCFAGCLKSRWDALVLIEFEIFGYLAGFLQLISKCWRDSIDVFEACFVFLEVGKVEDRAVAAPYSRLRTWCGSSCQ